MPVPFFANTSEDREVLLSQKGVAEVFQLAETAPLKIVGIGTVEAETQLVTSGMLEPAEIEQIRAAGGKGEMLGHFFDAEGRVLEVTLTSRTLVVSSGDGRADQLVRYHVIGLGPRAALGLQGHRRSGGISGDHDGQPLSHIANVEGGRDTVMRRRVVEQLSKGDTGPKSLLSRGVKWAAHGAAPMRL